MAYRTTRNDVAKMLARLAEAQGRPAACYARQEDGTLQPNAGALELQGAYGGYQISEIGPDGGSTSLTSGFQSIGMVTEFIRGALWATHWANQREAARVAKEN